MDRGEASVSGDRGDIGTIGPPSASFNSSGNDETTIVSLTLSNLLLKLLLEKEPLRLEGIILWVPSLSIVECLASKLSW